MTITEIQDMITDKLGRSDTNSIADCKRFLKRRYKMIWDNTLWLESLATAVEWVTDRDVTISSNPEVYYSGGSSAKLERVIAVNFSEADVYTVNSITASSGDSYFKYQMSDTSDFSANETFYAYGFPNDCPSLNGKKSVDVLHAEYVASSRPANWQGSTGSYSITGWITKDSNKFSEVPPMEWWNHFRVDPSKLIEQDTTTLAPEGFVHIPKDSSGNARIRLIPGPSKEGLLHCLGKLAWTEPSDSEEPAISGIDEVLLAFGEGDMLERSRKHAKAQIKYQEASALLQGVREQQRQQFATDNVIIPHVYEESRTTLNFF